MTMATTRLAPGERLFTERRTATFRKEQFDYIHTGIVDESGEKWTTTELDEANLNQVYNSYRAKYGIPFPDEVSALRKHYGLSAVKMAEILGFGINQYRHYENGEMPSASNARVLIAIRDKHTFLDFVDASRGVLGKKEYTRIYRHVLGLGDYIRPMTTPSSMTGYVSFSREKIAAAVEYFIKETGGVFVTKMNKLLFYADFLCYRRKGYGLTGLEYTALQFGPVPANWGNIYSSIPGVEMNEYVFPDQSSGIRLESQSEPDMSVFDEAQIEVLKDICTRFNGVNAGEISNISHKEKGWIDNHATKAHIDYNYAFDLSIL